MPRNTITSNRQRAESLSRTLRAKGAIRREVRERLASWLATAGMEPPNGLAPAVENEWPHEVRRVVTRLRKM